MPLNDRRIRVTHIITRLVRGGAAQVVLSNAAGLDKSRFKSTIVCGPESGSEGDCFEDARRHGVPVHIIPSLVRDISPVKDLKALLNMIDILRRTRVDIVHTHTSKAGVLGRFAAAISGIRAVVHSPHGHIFGKDANIPGVTGRPLRKAFFYFLERAAAPQARKIVTLTARNRNDHIALGLASPSKLSVLHNAVDVDCFEAAKPKRDAMRAELGYEPDDCVIGIIGRLTSEKGHKSLLEAFCTVSKKMPKVRLLVVGGGPLRGELERAARELELDDCVRFLGVREDVPELMSASDIVALASTYEGLGIVLLEAMALGKPVVATRVGGVPEIVVGGETGLLVGPNDPQAMADAIERLARDENMCARMGNAGKKRVQESFTMPIMLKRLEKLYEDVLTCQRR
jgi:glycosyltransferase involved in cell wall biosynthesis